MGLPRSSASPGVKLDRNVKGTEEGHTVILSEEIISSKTKDISRVLYAPKHPVVHLDVRTLLVFCSPDWELQHKLSAFVLEWHVNYNNY